MASRDPNQQLERNPTAEEEDEGIDFDHVKEIVGFVLRAPRRRPKLAAAVFTLGAALGISAAVTMPRTYSSQVRLLAQTNLLIPGVRREDSPTKDLADQILRRDNIIALAKETNLVRRYYAARSPALKLKDKLLGGPGTEDDKLRVVVATLEKNVSVVIENNNVTIGVDWYDGQAAYDLVTTVQKNFQAARYDEDVAMSMDGIAVLQQHAKVEADAVDVALEEYRKLAAESAQGTVEPPQGTVAAGTRAVPRSAPSPRAPSAAAMIDPDVAEALEDKRRQIRSLEAERQRDLDLLRGQLAQAQLTLTPQHPTVIALQQKIDSLSAPDAPLAQLKAEERALMASIAPPLPPPVKITTPASAGTEKAPVPLVSTLGTPKEDPRAQLVRAKLEGAIHRYQDAVGRIDSANMELEVARSAFKYRFTVVTPAEVPRKPKKAIGATVGVGSVIGSLLVALLLAAGADLWSGRILEEWQVRRRLKLEILGEFDATASLPSRSA